MAEHGWGHDPDFVDDSKSIQRKLFWLAMLSSVGGVAFAFNHWMFGAAGFHWLACVISATCGAVGAALFSRGENLPIQVAVIPGLIAGAGAYTATAGYISFRHTIVVLELFIPSLIGSAPGIVLYIVFVRIYHAASE